LDLNELKKLADAMDDNGKRELIYFLQSRTKVMAAPIRAIDEIQEQKHKDGPKLDEAIGGHLSDSQLNVQYLDSTKIIVCNKNILRRLDK
jgi:hypothetical protein